MEHIAIDLGGRESQICIRSEDGELLLERRCPTSSLGWYLEKRPKPSRVILETCAEAFAVADQAKAMGHEVRIVPGKLVRQLGVGDRGLKSDRRDAQALSQVSCRIDLPSVHIPGALSRRRKAMCGMRTSLVSCRTMLVNTVRSWLRMQGLPPLRRGGVETFAARVRERYAEELVRCVERQLETIEHLNGQIKDADAELATMAEKDESSRRLMTVPGVGPVTAVLFAAAVDEVERFPDAHRLESYLGLVPGEHSSSERQRRTEITKAGAPAVRCALIQAAWAARRSRGCHPMVQWSYEVEKRRGRRVAIVALARKLAGVMYALLRDEARYRVPASG